MSAEKRPRSPEPERICAHCRYATVLENASACVCKKKGAVRPDGHCLHYRLDLLKLRPHLPLLPDAGSPEEDGIV